MDLLERIGNVSHKVAEACRPALRAKSHKPAPRPAELRSQKDPPLALGGFFRHPARSLPRRACLHSVKPLRWGSDRP